MYLLCAYKFPSVEGNFHCAGITDATTLCFKKSLSLNLPCRIDLFQYSVKFNSHLICTSICKAVSFYIRDVCNIVLPSSNGFCFERESLFLGKYVLVEAAAYLKETQGWILSSISDHDRKKRIHTRSANGHEFFHSNSVIESSSKKLTFSCQNRPW